MNNNKLIDRFRSQVRSLVHMWNSEDGISWVQVDTMDGFTPRAFHSGLVFHNRMWIIAGMTVFRHLQMMSGDLVILIRNELK